MSLTRWLGVSFALLSACSPYNPISEDDTFADCCDGRGKCVPGGLIPPMTRDQLAADSCGASLVCAPLAFFDAAYAGPSSCRAAGDLEGRCLPSCLPQIAAHEADLEQRTCATGELCAPCFDPLTGRDSGACHIGGDPGPKERGRGVELCCEDRGRCLSREILASRVSSDDLARLDDSACSDANAVCVPEAWLARDGEPASRKPSRCTAPGDFEGRCLPSCLPDIASRASSLSRESCADGELCVPCIDPRTGEDSGACRIDGDRPQEPARGLGSCCDGQARCMPRALLEQSIDASDLARLEPLDCAELESVCVPSAWLEPSFSAPETCRAPGDFEGRCLPSCFPEIAARADALSQGSCSSGERCVPCFDPRTGGESGACSIADDAPREPARSFARCCGDRALCVPRELVPESSVDRLGAVDCTDDDALCVPEAWLDEHPPLPAACRAPGDLEGRCLSTCVPSVAAQADALSQASCDESERCVPCFDPRSGEATGACTTGSDQPADAARTFADCCGDRGSCIPRDVLAQSGTANVEQLGRDTCSAENAMCVMKSWLDAEKPEGCRAPGDLEGRCLPACLPALAANQSSLRRASCEDGELCTPCFDPRTVDDSGVCHIAGDAPIEAGRGFERCCMAAGHCVPDELLTSAQRDGLPVDTCKTKATHCAPTQLEAGLTACTSGFSGRRGACIPECLIPADSIGFLSRESCGARERCVECSQIPSGLGVACP